MVWTGVATVSPASANDVSYQVMEFDQLDGWASDDHAAALKTFLNTCRDMKDIDWRAVCKFAESNPEPRQFFELFFRPVLIEDGQDPLFTGYFEPELDGDLYRSARYRYPVYKMPSEALQQNPWLTRRQILDGDVMSGRGLEIANCPMVNSSVSGIGAQMGIRIDPSGLSWSDGVSTAPIR